MSFEAYKVYLIYDTKLISLDWGLRILDTIYHRVTLLHKRTLFSSTSNAIDNFHRNSVWDSIIFGQFCRELNGLSNGKKIFALSFYGREAKCKKMSVTLLHNLSSNNDQVLKRESTKTPPKTSRTCCRSKILLNEVASSKEHLKLPLNVNCFRFWTKSSMVLTEVFFLGKRGFLQQPGIFTMEFRVFAYDMNFFVACLK